MQKYLEPILTAAVFFPLLAALFTLPYMIYCYRRYGAVLVMRVALMYAFLYYLICVYFLAILPFPREGTVVTQRTTVNLIPFNYVPEVLDSGVTFSWDDPKSWLVAIYSSGLYEPLCNVLMFFPLGIFLLSEPLHIFRTAPGDILKTRVNAVILQSIGGRIRL